MDMRRGTIFDLARQQQQQAEMFGEPATSEEALDSSADDGSSSYEKKKQKLLDKLKNVTMSQVRAQRNLAEKTTSEENLDSSASEGSQNAFEKKKQRLIDKLKNVSLSKVRAQMNLATIDKLDDKVMRHVLSFLRLKELLRCASVNKKWRTLVYDSRLWSVISLRAEYGGLTVSSIDALLALISVRFGPSLRLIEIPMDLIQINVLHELANKCPKLRHMTLDFANAMQLHDFNDLQYFPARLRTLILCLSEVIFLEGFMRKIYNFISSVEILQLIGTAEKVEDQEPEVYEVVNLQKLKAYVPNLRVVNFWGVTFLNDEHLESLSTNCSFLECIAINFCQKVKGEALKPLLQRCKKVRCLLMDHCLLDSRHVMAVKWEDTRIEELNITATELSAECLTSILTRLPYLRWLSAGYLECFTNQVMDTWGQSGMAKNLQYLDLGTSDSLGEASITDFLAKHGGQLKGLLLTGIPTLAESFWLTNLPIIKNILILSMGTAEDCCQKVRSKIQIDAFLDCVSNNCAKLERFEVAWDPESIRFSDRSTKFIDGLRIKCLNLRALTLSDGRYFELVKSNFERADRISIVRTTTTYHTSIATALTFYNDLLFN